jgi:hypothetical protein
MLAQRLSSVGRAVNGLRNRALNIGDCVQLSSANARRYGISTGKVLETFVWGNARLVHVQLTGTSIVVPFIDSTLNRCF